MAVSSFCRSPAPTAAGAARPGPRRPPRVRRSGRPASPGRGPARCPAVSPVRSCRSPRTRYAICRATTRSISPASGSLASRTASLSITAASSRRVFAGMIVTCSARRVSAGPARRTSGPVRATRGSPSCRPAPAQASVIASGDGLTRSSTASATASTTATAAAAPVPRGQPGEPARGRDREHLSERARAPGDPLGRLRCRRSRRTSGSPSPDCTAGSSSPTLTTESGPVSRRRSPRNCGSGTRPWSRRTRSSAGPPRSSPRAVAPK